MQFTVVKLFNHKSFGLDSPHYAVVADMPADMGGGQRVVDMFDTAEVESPERLQAAFAQAKNKMPHRATPDGGGEIDFYTTDSCGRDLKQSTAYIPPQSILGKGFADTLIDWLSWRSRVALWLQDGQRPSLSAKMEARILETVVPRDSVPAVTAILPQLTALEARVVPEKPHDYVRDGARAPLTQKPASL